MKNRMRIAILATVFLFSAAAAGFAGGLGAALESANKQMQAVKDSFEEAEQKKMSDSEKQGLITMDGDEPVNESEDLPKEKPAKKTSEPAKNSIK